MLLARWGCEAPAPAPVFSTTCPLCLGWEVACKQCGGRGEVRRNRCPASQTDAAARFVVDVYDAMANGATPFDGLGWAELPDSLIRLVRVVGLERARIAEDERRIREARSKADAARGKRSG